LAYLKIYAFSSSAELLISCFSRLLCTLLISAKEGKCKVKLNNNPGQMELLDGDGREKSWEIKRKIRELLLTLLTLRLPVQLDFLPPPPSCAPAKGVI